MSDTLRIAGRAALLRVDNLDTDQIMPKQFLRGIDRSGLARGVLYDLRFDAEGQPRADFVLNQPGPPVRVLLGGANFGCGSSREHAVWGLMQYGIEAVIAPGFGEIFFSNAMQNRLLLVTLPAETIESLAEAAAGNELAIDLERLRVRCGDVHVAFELGARHRQKMLTGEGDLDLSLKERPAIEAFAQAHWRRHPWLKDVAAVTRARLDAAG